VPGRGSAIFLHADTGRATAGCVSISLARLVRVLRWLRPSASPVIAIR
jgi:L,D-peptidoglycan transpeptidase YkuD (ErfK/YbiS/YcfS/YnhG family)